MIRLFKNKVKTLSDELLVQQYQQTSDMGVLGKLYERYMELVYGVCLKYLKDSGKAEDAVMAIFEELVVKLKKYEVKKFKPWLHVMTKNHCLLQIRKDNKSSLVYYDTELMQLADLPHPLDVEDSEEEEQYNALEQCINALPTKQKACVELFYYQGKTYKEIAAMQNVDISKVRSFIQNGRRNLKICIEKKTAKGSFS